MKGHIEQVGSVTASRAGATGAALVVMMAVATVCCAGEIKGHDWPCTFLTQTIPDLEMPVYMDVAEVYSFVIVASAVRLEQVDEETFSGCSQLVAICTFNLTLTCTIEPTGVVPGDYSCSVDPADIDAPFGTATLCAEVRNVRLDSLPAPNKALTVAMIRIRVTPR
jgi:hypothetical protein